MGGATTKPSGTSKKPLISIRAIPPITTIRESYTSIWAGCAKPETALLAVLRIDPTNQQAHRYLASILQRQNRHREALKHYFVSVQLDPRDAKSWHGIGRIQTQLKEDSLAVAAFEQAVALDTSYAEAVYNLSLAYRKIGRLHEAQSAMERARFLRGQGDKNERQARLMTTHPDLALDQYGLGKLYESRGWSAMARARFYRARRLGLRDEEMEQTLPQSDPRSLPSRATSRQGGDAAQGIRNGRGALSRCRAPSTGKRAQLPQYGTGAVTQERPEEALIAYREAMQLDSGLAAAHSDLALLYSKNFSQHLKAIELLDKALELEPQNKLYWYNLAHVYLTLGQYDKAAERFERVLDFDPHSALTLYSLGLALSKHGSHQAALDRLQQALEINPEYEDAHYQLGTVYRALGRLDEAAAAYERCLSFNPDHRYASYGLGQVYMQLGQQEAAQSISNASRVFRTIARNRNTCNTCSIPPPIQHESHPQGPMVLLVAGHLGDLGGSST